METIMGTWMKDDSCGGFLYYIIEGNGPGGEKPIEVWQSGDDFSDKKYIGQHIVNMLYG